MFIKLLMQEVELNGSKWVGRAKWSHIKDAVDEDSKRLVRMMRKLTPTHLEPTGASAMKVNLAAQVGTIRDLDLFIFNFLLYIA